MPNLLPDWLPWIHPAGRLIWSTGVLIVGIAFVVALIKPPVLTRPFSTKVGVALFPIILVVGLVLAKIITPIQRGIVWVTIAALVAHGFLMVVSRKPRDPEQVATWAECFAGAVGAFALFALGYAIIPHEWLTYANSYLNWGDSTQFIFKSNEEIFFLPVNWPFNLDYPAVRDIVVTVIYVVMLGVNIKLFVMWQKRFEVKTAPDGADAPVKRSRFGRPLRRTPVSAGATPEGA